MAFGFGFNKAKTLSSAEKNVMAGKLQHAIADYEKIIKEDPKDLTVLNAIGDLHARLGKTDQAVNYYKRVADAFAGNGFTVKAIAMYKKITKLDGSSVDSLTRLAELYAQQGLHSDARSQYAAVAEHHLKAGKLDEAARVFHKVLDLDPENAPMQAKLAELYVRLGKKSEARDIYFRNAELYRSRKNFPAADESLGHVLTIDKGFSQALLLRGLVKMELGDAASAVTCLEQVPDLDTRPEGLRSMLRAYFKLGNLDAAGPLARKLHTVFHESNGLASYGEALVSAGRAEEALALYSEFGDALLSSQSEAVIQSLQGCIARVKENPAALEQLSGLLEGAGQTANLAEIKELLAHASVQSGDLAKARDLYRELARIEPDNPLHTQNYRQVLAKLGEDPSARPLTAEEGAQPVLADELERPMPELPRDYAPELTEALRAALTEAELFDSYNLPAKALTPLEAVLSRAPHDAPLNQRLASLYARISRFADAAARFQVLEQIYKRAGFTEQANEYAELASKYAQRSGTPLSAAPVIAPSKSASPTAAAAPSVETHVATPENVPAFHIEPAVAASHQTGSVAEFEFTPTPEPHVEPHVEAHITPASFELHVAPAEPVVTAAQPHTPAPAATFTPSNEVVPSTPAVAEFDLSSEWEDMVEVEVEPAAVAEIMAEPAASHASTHADNADALADTPHEVTPVAEVAAHSEAPVFGAQPEANAEAHDTTVAELTELASGDAIEIPESAAHAHEFAFDQPVNSDAAIFDMLGTAPETGYPQRTTDLIEEIRFYVSQGMWDEVERGLTALAHEAPEAAHDLRGEIAAYRGPVQPASAAEPVAHHDVLAEFEAAPESAPDAAAEPLIFSDPAPVTEPASVLQPLEFAASASPQPDSFDGLFDLDSALGADFELAPAMAGAADNHAVSASAGNSAPVHAVAVPAPVAMSAAAGSTTGYSAPPSAPSAMSSTATLEPPSHTLTAPTAPMNDTALDFSDGALADIFAEFKNDMESGSSEGEDPETHYNLGVAFKEMGLLDEAIGELQKVCQAIDQGHAFSQVLQAYTWLADCFVQKGVPEAAIRWYEKALRSPHVEGETATAIHYELACACEQAGNRGGALSHFMEVYGANIDYRDVADRIKSLK